MEWIIIIGVIWWLCYRATPPEARKRQKRINRAVTTASALWFLDAIVNADKRNRY